MESDYDYWWWNATKTTKQHIEDWKSLFVEVAIDGLLKCA